MNRGKAPTVIRVIRKRRVRATRLAFIAESQRQGVEVATSRRAAQLSDREAGTSVAMHQHLSQFYPAHRHVQ